METGGSATERTVKVTKVEGLLMDFDVIPVLGKAALENSLLRVLERQVGAGPGKATCSGR